MTMSRKILLSLAGASLLAATGCGGGDPEPRRRGTAPPERVVSGGGEASKAKESSGGGESQAATASGWGTIKGRVVWTGASVPAPPALTVTKDQNHCLTKGPIPDETLMVDADSKGVLNTYVYFNTRKVPAIHSDYPQSKDDVAKAFEDKFAEVFGQKPGELEPGSAQELSKKVQPAESVVPVIDQLYCRYVPHSIAVREGERVLTLNPEPVAHNVKVNSFGANSSNLNMPPGQFNFYDWRAESNPLPIECSIHGWMKMNAMIFKHPYFAVTGKDGSFELKNLPAGAVDLTVRNPGYIVRKHTVDLKPDQTVEVEIQYDGDKGTVVVK